MLSIVPRHGADGICGHASFVCDVATSASQMGQDQIMAKKPEDQAPTPDATGHGHTERDDTHSASEIRGHDEAGPADLTAADNSPVSPASGIKHTRAGAAWTGLVIGILVLILLLVFILQNLDQVALKVLFWNFSVPLGVAILIAAIAGAIIMALAGGVRILQIRRALKKH